jgi:hypothetical protein
MRLMGADGRYICAIAYAIDIVLFAKQRPFGWLMPQPSKPKSFGCREKIELFPGHTIRAHCVSAFFSAFFA